MRLQSVLVKPDAGCLREFVPTRRVPVAGWAVIGLLLGLPATTGRSGAADFSFRETAPNGLVELLEGGKPVFGYQHGTNAPGELLARISPDNRKYAIARSDYLHPLFGPEGKALTRDWSVDHPHHRGIYWAWPEVDYRGQRGDLHALQQVFAHPLGAVRTSTDAKSATLMARSSWIFGVPVDAPAPPGVDPCLQETVVLRAGAAAAEGRSVDLFFGFQALGEPVKVARRGTDKYGGLNIRLAPVRGQEIRTHTDPPESAKRAAWAQLSGVFEGATKPATLLILQHAGNPEYPGDWVQYPELNWLQPTFPAAGHRYEITSMKPLRLAYRLWIRPGGLVSDAEARRLWEEFQSEKLPNTLP